ncbi:MAG: hypothetical protein HOE85_06930, partial [Nitrospinaceae bacterium]|nr:hypothetical protein [Nitrospinaceae bacterium]
MSEQKGANTSKTLDAIKTLGFTHVLAVPDSESARLFEAVGEDPDIELILPTREGESIAIAAGLWTGGLKPLVMIQNTGFMEAGDALRG